MGLWNRKRTLYGLSHTTARLVQLGWHLIKKKWLNTTFLLGLIDDLEKGDTFATLMGWLDDVDAGGGTVFADGEVVKVTTIHSTFTIFTTKICEKCPSSIPGFELTTFET